MGSKLPDTIVASRADATARKYIGAFGWWKAWAGRYGMEAIPVKDFQFVLYLQHLADTSRSKAAVDKVCNALAWVHSAVGLTPPTASTFVCATKKELQRSLAKPVVKSPVTVEMLAAMVEDLWCSGVLADLRLATACLLAFASFFHFNELVSLRACDIMVYKDLATVHIAHSKTDQLQKGDKVVIARTGNST